jgi:hypothetical protein
MNVDRFFVECLDELESRATWESSEYSLLRAGGLLRELLIDGLPVVREVNRERRLTLTFRVRRPPTTNDVVAWHINSLDPNTEAEDGTIEDLDLDHLLQVPVIHLGPDRLTIKDIVTLAANVRGGVHRGKPETREHKLIEAFQLKVTLGETPAELIALIPIVSVVLRGLEPLREAARRDMPPELPLEPGGGRRVTATYTPQPGVKPKGEATLEVRYTEPTNPNPATLRG